MLGREGLQLFGQRKKESNKCIVKVIDGYGKLFTQRGGEQISVVLEQLARDFKGVRKIYSLDKTQLHHAHLLDQWVGKRGMNFVAWKVKRGEHVVLLVPHTLENIHEEIDMLEELVDVTLLLDVGASCKGAKGSIQHNMIRVTHGFLSLTTTSRDDVYSYVGVGNNFSAAIDSIARSIK